MKLQKKKKQALTLLEIMIVIFLIGLIGGVVGYNVKGSLEKGKAFKTSQGAKQIEEILLLEISSGADPQDVIANPGWYLSNSGFCKDPNALLKDGWGESYVISLGGDQQILVYSKKLDEYNKSHGPRTAQ